MTVGWNQCHWLVWKLRHPIFIYFASRKQETRRCWYSGRMDKNQIKKKKRCLLNTIRTSKTMMIRNNFTAERILKNPSKKASQSWRKARRNKKEERRKKKEEGVVIGSQFLLSCLSYVRFSLFIYAQFLQFGLHYMQFLLFDYAVIGFSVAFCGFTADFIALLRFIILNTALPDISDYVHNQDVAHIWSYYRLSVVRIINLLIISAFFSFS